jgi:hypothetical protein
MGLDARFGFARKLAAFSPQDACFKWGFDANLAAFAREQGNIWASDIDPVG